MTFQRHQLHAATGRPIVLRHYGLATDRYQKPKKTIVVAPALGVPQSFYQKFCGWLVTEGFQVISFDYFGVGESRNGSLRNHDTSANEWAELDAQAVLNWVAKHLRGEPCVWFAHSVSGQLFGMIPDHQMVDEVVTIATGSGYWRENAPQLRAKAWMLWHLLVPVLVPLAGYFPGARFGIVGDIPKTAMWQWRRWCLHPGYILGVEDSALATRFAQVTQPMTSVHIDDDEMLTQRNVDQVHDFYKNARQQRLVYQARDFKLARLGHFDIFRQSKTGEAWPAMYLPLLTQR